MPTPLHPTAPRPSRLNTSTAQLLPDRAASTPQPHRWLSPSAFIQVTVDKGSSHRNTERPIPAFVTKLFTMVNDPNTDHLIKWSEPNGDSFFVVSSERFGRELLPKFFKHSNFGSPLLFDQRADLSCWLHRYT
ncbi:stress-responsive transcription factor hsf1 [Puccinia graminis f. sp. tritici]|uniref:Stress-responsive transcription factor hsf1 n=1 Tax=Puccinia graminis f. sp. tritici TaxID=56615 RepID=A0A5B0R4R7_PUCGR|nr:stress-responsive transcription factor hsf1 [Puccinia graminis f. sp. tritici]